MLTFLKALKGLGIKINISPNKMIFCTKFFLKRLRLYIVSIHKIFIKIGS